MPDLDIFPQGLIERMNGGWRVTDKGAGLDIMEARPAPAQATELPAVSAVEDWPLRTRRKAQLTGELNY